MGTHFRTPQEVILHQQKVSERHCLISYSFTLTGNNCEGN